MSCLCVCVPLHIKYTFAVHQPWYYVLNGRQHAEFCRICFPHRRRHRCHSQLPHKHTRTQSIIVDVMSSNHCASSALARTCHNHFFRDMNTSHITITNAAVPALYNMRSKLCCLFGWYKHSSRKTTTKTNSTGDAADFHVTAIFFSVFVVATAGKRCKIYQPQAPHTLLLYTHHTPMDDLLCSMCDVWDGLVVIANNIIYVLCCEAAYERTILVFVQ